MRMAFLTLVSAFSLSAQANPSLLLVCDGFVQNKAIQMKMVKVDATTYLQSNLFVQDQIVKRESLTSFANADGSLRLTLVDREEFVFELSVDGDVFPMSCLRP